MAVPRGWEHPQLRLQLPDPWLISQAGTRDLAPERQKGEAATIGEGIRLAIPGWGYRHLRYLVADLNGTLALDGRIPEAVRQKLKVLAGRLEIYVLTADTFGNAASELGSLPVRLRIVHGEDSASGKLQVVRDWGRRR